MTQKKTMGERVAVIEEVVLRMEERLFGNGQPGELEKIQGRVRRLEQWFWRAAGAISVVLALFETLRK